MTLQINPYKLRFKNPNTSEINCIKENKTYNIQVFITINLIYKNKTIVK